MSGTVSELLIEEERNLLTALADLRKVLGVLNQDFPEVLDLEVSRAGVWSEGYLAIHLQALDRQTCCKLLTKFHEVAGLEHVHKDFTATPGYEVVFFCSSKLTIRVARYVRKKQEPCRRYRVARVVEICGEPDRNFYESVELLEDEDVTPEEVSDGTCL